MILSCETVVINNLLEFIYLAEGGDSHVGENWSPGMRGGRVGSGKASVIQPGALSLLYGNSSGIFLWLPQLGLAPGHSAIGPDSLALLEICELSKRP